MTKSMGLMVCAGMALCSVAAAHPGTPSTAPWSGETHRAISAAKVTRNMATGEVRMVGGWVQLDQNSRGTVASTWDGFESCPLGTPGGAPVGFVDNTNNSPDDCGGAGNRWYFGGDYDNVHWMNDYADAVPGDVLAGNMAIWFNPPASTGCLVFIFNWDTVSLDGAVLGNGEAMDGFIDGVILNYGALAPQGGGWSYLYYDALPAGFLSTAADGNGAYEMIVAESFQDTDGDGTPDTIFVHATAAGDNFAIQPMLWGTGEDELPAPQADRVGTGTEVQYDDDNPLDGAFADGDADGFVDEAYSYAFGVAPNPLGACMEVMGAGGPPPCAADFNGDGFLDFFDVDAFVECFEGGSCPPGRSCDYNGDFFCDFFDSDAFVADFEAGC